MSDQEVPNKFKKLSEEEVDCLLGLVATLVEWNQVICELWSQARKELKEKVGDGAVLMRIDEYNDEHVLHWREKSKDSRTSEMEI